VNLTSEETATRLRVSLRTLEGWRNRRQGPPFRKFGRKVLYPLDLLEQWEAKQTVETR
jgi:hypothetical protein